MSANNKVSANIEIAKTELEETMNLRLDEFKSETTNSIDRKLSTLNSNKHPSSNKQTSSDITK